MWETSVQSLDWEDLLEEGMGPTLVFLPREPYGQRSLVSYSPCGHRVIRDLVTFTFTFISQEDLDFHIFFHASLLLP